MFPSAYLLVLLAQPTLAERERPASREIAVSTSANTLDLTWNDVEDRLQGAITPKAPVEGLPLDLSIHVGSFQGEEFNGPVTFSLKPVDNKGGGMSQTVKRARGEKAWKVTFVPEEAGLHTLEVSFTTTRMKVAATKIEVQEARLPRWPWWVMVGVAGGVALGLGVRSVFKKQENT
jgi:hypothetical protein